MERSFADPHIGIVYLLSVPRIEPLRHDLRARKPYAANGGFSDAFAADE